MRIASFFLAFLGFVLIYLEFFLPGAVLGVLGGFLLFVGLMLTFLYEDSLLFTWVYTSLVVLGVVVVIQAALWSIKRKKIFHELQHKEGGSGEMPSEDLVGKEALVETDLKPFGYIVVGEKSFEAFSKSGYLEKGIQVEIVGREENHVIVRRK
jgi:membrane-bound serine protease (ClpP class)